MSSRPDAVDKANPTSTVVGGDGDDAADCYMCRLMSQHTNRLRCPKCGTPIFGNLNK